MGELHPLLPDAGRLQQADARLPGLAADRIFRDPQLPAHGSGEKARHDAGGRIFPQGRIPQQRVFRHGPGRLDAVPLRNGTGCGLRRHHEGVHAGFPAVPLARRAGAGQRRGRLEQCGDAGLPSAAAVEHPRAVSSVRRFLRRGAGLPHHLLRQGRQTAAEAGRIPPAGEEECRLEHRETRTAGLRVSGRRRIVPGYARRKARRQHTGREALFRARPDQAAGHGRNLRQSPRQ